MDIIWMLVIGLIIGAIAKLLMPGSDPGGFIITALIGVAGSMVAGMIGRSAGWYRPGEPAGFIAAVIGAVALLAVYRAVIVRGNTRPGH
ncbi:MAG: GlsB/YeaQ/YmgE family stress response membrane protein [Myxococcales bacterium]|nr:GlsB/YeaQ/YmgE family stress response membrane protein [Myxococcales bacterium]MBK7192027.1 GlsB/YeaQ/YmgE family stress response membrane protein [Myxococcales bacterium]